MEGEYSLADDQLASSLLHNLWDVGCRGHSQTRAQNNNQVSLTGGGEEHSVKDLHLLHSTGMSQVPSPHKR